MKKTTGTDNSTVSCWKRQDEDMGNIMWNEAKRKP